MGVVILNGKRLQTMACCYCIKRWHIFIVYLLIFYEISCYYGFERPVFEIIKDGLLDFRKDIIRKRIGVF